MQADTVMDFRQALTAIHQADRQGLRSHLTLADLEAYHRQDLSPEQRQKAADHLVLCEDCLALLLYGVIALTGGNPSADEIADLPDAEVERAWRRLEPRLEDPIDQLYEEIIAMNRQPPSPGKDEEIARAWSHLRELQEAEAASFRREFLAGLEMPIDAGASILARAEALRERVADLASQDAAARRADRP